MNCFGHNEHVVKIWCCDQPVQSVPMESVQFLSHSHCLMFLVSFVQFWVEHWNVYSIHILVNYCWMWAELYSKALVLGLANMIRSIIPILLDPDSHLKFYALKLNRKITSVMILFLCFYFRPSPSYNLFYNQLNVIREVTQMLERVANRQIKLLIGWRKMKACHWNLAW